MQLITQAEAASILNVSIRTITRYRQAGLLQTVKINRQTIRIPKMSVEKFIGRITMAQEAQEPRLQKYKGRYYIYYRDKDKDGNSRSLEYRRGQMIWLSQRHGSKVG